LKQITIILFLLLVQHNEPNKYLKTILLTKITDSIKNRTKRGKDDKEENEEEKTKSERKEKERERGNRAS
jgi:hypothetical protein